MVFCVVGLCGLGCFWLCIVLDVRRIVALGSGFGVLMRVVWILSGGTFGVAAVLFND